MSIRTYQYWDASSVREGQGGGRRSRAVLDPDGSMDFFSEKLQWLMEKAQTGSCRRSL